MKRLDGIKAWIGDREGAVLGALGFVTGRDRHHGGIGCRIDIEVRDKNGKLIRGQSVCSKSFNESFFRNISSLYTRTCTTAPNICIIAADDGEMYCSDMGALSGAGDWCDNADAAVDAFGVLVGTSSTAWAFTQYALVGKIAHGGAGGQLSYGACSTSDVTDSGTPAKCTIQRSFDNNSGAEITVREIGWFGKMKYNAGTKYHMIARDVITATAIPNGGRLAVKYTILINPT